MRKIENPKKKKEKHVILTSFFDKNMAERIANKNKITNQDVRKLLKEIIEK